MYFTEYFNVFGALSQSQETAHGLQTFYSSHTDFNLKSRHFPSTWHRARPSILWRQVWHSTRFCSENKINFQGWNPFNTQGQSQQLLWVCYNSFWWSESVSSFLLELGWKGFGAMGELSKVRAGRGEGTRSWARESHDVPWCAKVCHDGQEPPFGPTPYMSFMTMCMSLLKEPLCWIRSAGAPMVLTWNMKSGCLIRINHMSSFQNLPPNSYCFSQTNYLVN